MVAAAMANKSQNEQTDTEALLRQLIPTTEPQLPSSLLLSNNILPLSTLGSSGLNHSESIPGQIGLGLPSQSSSNESSRNPHSTSSPSTCRPIRSQRTPMKEITTLDDPSELDEFMAQGEEACINDMKQFITQFSLRQTTVAMMTGNFYQVTY